MDAKAIAQALEQCDWSGVSIGNKAVLQAAIDELQRLQGIIDRVISTSKVLAEKSPSTPWGDGYKECAIETGNALEDMLRLEGKA